MTTGLLYQMHAQRGHFAFESGFHGDLRLDLDGFFDRPHEIAPHIDELAEHVRALDADIVCGPYTGGALVAYRIAEQLGLDFLASERTVPPVKDGLFPHRYRLSGLPSRVTQRRVVVVDDVINAGSATGATLNALLAHDAVPVAIATILTLGSSAADMAATFGIRLVTTAQEQISLWQPNDCPLCAQGRPVGWAQTDDPCMGSADT